MTQKDKKERERREMQELILNAAAEIFKEEGLEKLSVRKIASRIEYSPAIIYHYFKDKDEIISCLMERGYSRIVEGLSSVPRYIDNPSRTLRELTLKLIEIALQLSVEYKAIQLSTSSSILEYTSSLFRGAAEKKAALGILYQCLKSIFIDMSHEQLELTAQIIWTSTFGLIIKLIIEKELPEDQRQRLINHHIRCVLDAMIFGEELR